MLNIKNIQQTVKLATTVAALMCFSSLAQAYQYEQTARLINERLSYMKDVAGYKAEQHLPIEDLTQEKKVLDQSLSEADAFGLNSETVKPFIVAQMDVAKAIQYRYRADWLSNPETNWKPQDLSEVRVKISALNTELLKNIAYELKKNNNKAPHGCSYMWPVQHPQLKEADKRALCVTLNKIKLKQ
ncbi:putative chorismate mutase [Acinetobacter baumannii 25493_8]|uniref:chorismate mutase n=1 Tax=Acinetobacter baumannii TaxID=470 RepID=UPI0002B9F1F9|nr:chorismate mutase [Acinetobacter baumannii]EYS11615.1 putative chorismate mutase [Acinetobacter baumannii 25569_7]EHU2135805.1 chorismate mutase [Acinetobacter baumannii]EHU2364641.1 chorismate mutase [Acinetobacter baumannii]EHU3227860.1 chorismate mutase [Acinetobacter baumannii]EIG0126822.1 chorismate mutase [Acinetobacter baumannii]